MEPRLSTTLIAGPRSSTTARTKVTPRSSSTVVPIVSKREPKSYAEQFRIQTILREQTVPGFPPRKNISKNKKTPPTKTNKLSTSISASSTINSNVNVTQLNSTKLKVPNQFKNQIKTQNQSQLQLTLKSKLSAAAAAADRDRGLNPNPNRSRFCKLPNFNHGKRDRQVKGEGQPPVSVPTPLAKETKGKPKKCALCEKHSAGSIEDDNDSDDAALRSVPTRTLLTSQFGQDDLPDADSYRPLGPGQHRQQQQHQPQSEPEPAQNETCTRTSGFSEIHERQGNANLTSNSNDIQDGNQHNTTLTFTNVVTTPNTNVTNAITNGTTVDENNNYIPNEGEDIPPTPPQFQMEKVHSNLQRESHNSSNVESEVVVQNKISSPPVIPASSGRHLNSITCGTDKVDLPLKNSSKGNLDENAVVKTKKLQHSHKKSKQASSASGTTGKTVIKAKETSTSTKRPVGLKNAKTPQESFTPAAEKNSMLIPIKPVHTPSVKTTETEITKVITEKIPDQFTHKQGKIGDKKGLESPILTATTSSLAGKETNQVKNTHDEAEANSSPKRETKSDLVKLNQSLTNSTDTDADNIKILAQIEHEKLLLTKNNKNESVSTEKQAEKEVKKCSSSSSNSTAMKSLSNLETKNNINTTDNKRRTFKKTEEEVAASRSRSRSQSGSQSRSASQNKSKSETRSQSKLVAPKKENDKSGKITTAKSSSKSPKCEMTIKDSGTGARAGAGVGDTGKENQNPGVKTPPSKGNRRNAPKPIRRLLLPLSTEKVQPALENFNVQETPKYLLNKLEEGIFQVPSTENLSESDKAQGGGHINLSKIVLLYPEGNGMTGFLRLTNQSPQVVFYRIFPCTPDRYSIEPKEGKLEPNKAILIKLGTEDFMKEKNFEDDKFKIETVMTSADSSSHTASRRFWMNVPLSRIQTTYTTSVHLYDPNDSFFQKYWKHSRSATSNSKFAINLERSSSTSKTGLSLLRFMDVSEVVDDLSIAQQDLQSIRGREHVNVILAVLILSVGFWAIFNRLQIIPGLESVIKGKR